MNDEHSFDEHSSDEHSSDKHSSDDLHFHPDVAFEYLMTQPKTIAGVGATLVNIIKSELPDATSKMYQGIPVWLVADQPTVGIKAAKDFVSLMFFRGQRIDDASRTLVPTGSFEMATVKFSSDEQIDEQQIRGWLRQASSNDGAAPADGSLPTELPVSALGEPEAEPEQPRDLIAEIEGDIAERGSRAGHLGTRPTNAGEK